MKKVLRSSQVLTIVLVSLALSSVFFGVESAWAADGPEPLSMSTIEDVNILGNGTALVKLSINVGASPLADMYRELLAAPYDADVGEEMPIPGNKTEDAGVMPVREEFHRSIKQEQEASFGFATRIFNSSMVPRGEQGECRVSINACVWPQIISTTDVGSDVILDVVVGPKDENATGLALAFVLNKVGFAQMMLESLEGDQVYELEWTMRIKVPTEAALLNGGELTALSWAVNFGGGTSMSASVHMDGPSTIVLSERTLVTEQNMTATPTEILQAFSGYKAFNIRYQLPKSALAEGEDEWTSVLGSNWSKRWRWWVRPIRSLPFEAGPISGTLTVTPTFSLTVYMGWKWGGFLGLKLQWFKAWISIDVSVKFELDATITTAAKEPFEGSLYNKRLYRFSFSIGPVPVWADLDLSFEARLTVGAEGEVTLSTDVEVGASFKAGVRWRREAKGDIPKGWSTIWEKNLYGSLYDLDVTPWRIDASAEAFVGARISFMVYGLAGPFVEFGPYFSMDNDYHDSLDVAAWEVDTGWKLNVGVTFAGFLKDLLGLKTHPVNLGTWPTETWKGHWGIATSSISIDLEPVLIYKGSGTMVTGEISSDYAGNKYGKVYIEYSTDKDTWNPVGSTHSNADGEYSRWWVMSEAGTFYVRSWWEGNSGYKPATSDPAPLGVSSVVTGPQELGYDDDDPDFTSYHDPDSWYPEGIAVRFTPPASIWKLEKVHVYGGYPNKDANFYVEVWDSDRKELIPRQTCKYSDYFPQIIPDWPDWAKKDGERGIDIPDIYVTGDFYVVVSGDPRYNYELWVWKDWDWDPSPHRSYIVNLEDNSIIVSTDENYMIRAEGTSIVTFHGLNRHAGAFPDTMTAFKITDDYVISHIRISMTETVDYTTVITWWWYDPDGHAYQADQEIYDPGWNGHAYAYTPIEDNRALYEKYLGRPFKVKIWYYNINYDFLAKAATETFIVTKFRSSISVWLSSDSITYGNTVEISSLTYPGFDDGTTTLQYSIDEINWTDIAAGTPSSWPPGFYSHTWVPPHAGTYYIRAVWSGNLNYAGNTSETLTLTVNPASTSLSASLSSTIIIKGSTVTITATLTSAITGAPLHGRSITIQYSTDSITWYPLGINTTDSAGQTHPYEWTPDIGVYYVRSMWYGDDDYLESTSPSIQLTVEPSHYTIVEIVNGADAEIDRTPDATAEFAVRVKDQVTGEYLTNIGDVLFYVSDQSYFNNILVGLDNDTDGDGIYHIEWNTGNWSVLGPQPWGAHFEGTPEYMPSSASSTLTIYYYGVALWTDPTFQEVNVTSSVTHSVNLKWNNDTEDTFTLSLTGLDPSWYTLSQASITVDIKGQTEQVTLTITPPNAPTILTDYEFNVIATSQEDPSFSVSASATVRVTFSPTPPATPTGGLAIAVQPRTIYTLTGTTTSTNILVVNNQNFDDVITTDIRNTGIQPQYQANLTWFNWLRANVFLPAGTSIYIPLEIEVPADTPLGIYDFRAVATSTSDFAITAEDSGTINAADITPPTTTITLAGTPGLNGWYVSDVTITLTATDDLSGVASTEYSFDGTDWIPYTGHHIISSEGTTTVYYRSIDNAGNIELTNTATIVLDKTPPTTTLTIGEPKCISDKTYVTPDTPFTLEAADAGSGVYSTTYRIYNATFDSAWQTYTAPFKLTSLTDGTYTIEYNSTDNAGNIEPTHTVSVTLDNSGPVIVVENPPPGWALQDGVTFIASASDSSGTQSLNFSIREADGEEGIPVGFENIPATLNVTTGKWELFFDTLQLPDGFYIVLVSAEDNFGHTASITVPYSIRNWAVLELLPASTNNKAGRTMPVKFALRVAALVDPTQPFVYNEDLTIKIYPTDNPSNILQTSTFGDAARDYRINILSEQYITNFRTLKTPMEYTVAIYRNTFDVGSFTFETVK